MRVRREWLTVLLLLLLHFALHPLWSRWPIGPDLLAGGLLLGSFLLRWGRAAVFGCLLGLLEASISLGPLGLTMFLFSIFACIGGWLRRIVYSDSDTFVVASMFLGTWALRASVALLVQGDASMGALLVNAPASAALTTVLCWLVYRFVSAEPDASSRPVGEGLR